MALDPTTPRSRRALLTAAVAATAVTVVEAVVRPLPVSAAGDDGSVIHVGDLYADAQNQTTIANKANDGIVLYVASNPDTGHGGGTAIRGHSHHGAGVFGDSELSNGVRGESASLNGVFGYSASGNGVRGFASSGIGVSGEVLTGVGVSGIGSVDGVRGHAASGRGVAGDADTGTGVQGKTISGIGLEGQSFTGTGVRAQSSTGTALDVAGKAHFSRSGTATVTAGHKSVTVTVPGGLTGTPLCFANLRSYRSGIGVAAVRSNYPSAGKIRIYLTRTVSSATSVAWMVMD